MNEWKIQAVQNKICDHRQNLINHLDRMTDKRIPKHILQYNSKDSETNEDSGKGWIGV